MAVLHVTARAVIISSEQILLCKTTDRPANFYFLLGGHIQAGETATQALVRELTEELGYSSTIKRFLGCSEDTQKVQPIICHAQAYHFLFEVVVTDLLAGQHIPGHESIIFEWVSLVEMLEIDFRPIPFQTLRRLMENSSAEQHFLEQS